MKVGVIVNFGRYQTLKELGRGSMGVVYLARDPNIERLVAVKVLRQDRMGNDLFVRRFLKEAKVIGRLSHPNTVTIHDIGEEDGCVYIAMEYIEGTPLSDIIKGKRLDTKEVVEFGVQIAETLDYAHSKGVIHRDIKPSNIIVQPDGRIKITDFGIARIEDSNASLQTQAGETMGTPSYMSPEQVLGQTVDGRSDLFSLGVVLYELSTGKRPFGGEGKTLATVFNEIIQITPPEPDFTSGSVPRELSRVIMRSLQKEPAKRFQSGRELAESLNGCLGAGKKEAVAQKTPVDPVQRKSRGYAIPIAGAALIGVIAGGISFFSHHQETSPIKDPSESREAAPSVTQREGAIKPSPSAPPPAVKKVEPPVRVITKDQHKPLPSKVPAGIDTKSGVKPAVVPVKTVKPTPAPIAAGKIPAAIKAESTSQRLPADKTPAAPKPVAAETPGNANQTRQTGVLQTALPAKAKPLPKFAFLKVTTLPKGATVYVDGTKKGTSPVTIKLDLGSYRVKISRPGFRDMERLVRLEKMTKYTVSEKLSPLK